MKALALDPGNYQGSYKLVGGEVSLDLVNTVSWPDGERMHDWLDRPANFTAWADAVGILKEEARQRLEARRSPRLEEELAQVRDIRKGLDEVLRPLASGKTPPPEAVERLNRLIDFFQPLRGIDPASLKWTWDQPKSLPQVLAPVLWNATQVVTALDHTRLGHCPSCRWLFHDTTRNRSRRWCDMKDCGSRDKALRYYHRAKYARKS